MFNELKIVHFYRCPGGDVPPSLTGSKLRSLNFGYYVCQYLNVFFSTQ